MVSIRLRTNKQSTNSLFYFLHILFLLHIYTAFLTIVNSLNNNDNEGSQNDLQLSFSYVYLFTLAIIQLSTDSIHVVKSSDPRFTVSIDLKMSLSFFARCFHPRTLKKIPMMMKKKNCLLHY